MTDKQSIEDLFIKELEALRAYRKAMAGFAEAVRQETGLPYPWPAETAALEKLKLFETQEENKNDDKT